MSRKYWYAYTGPEGGEGSISNYALVASPAACVEGNLICAIYAFYGGDSYPLSISRNVSSYIANGKLSGVNQPIFGPFFVYTKTTIR